MSGANAWPWTGVPTGKRMRLMEKSTLLARGRCWRQHNAWPADGHAFARRPAALFRAWAKVLVSGKSPNLP